MAPGADLASMDFVICFLIKLQIHLFLKCIQCVTEMSTVERQNDPCGFAVRRTLVFTLSLYCPYLKIIAKILLYFHYIFLKREMIINELFGHLSHILLHQWKKFCPYTKVINLSSHVPLN